MTELLEFIDLYGYVAVFLLSTFEGEAAGFLGGILANQDFLTLQYVLIATALGAMFGDGSWFLIGRYRKAFVHRRFPKFIAKAERPLGYITRHPRTISFAIRFMYGFRAFMPVSIGISHIPARTFFFWNALGAFAWSFLIVWAGYFAGDFVQSIFGKLRVREVKIFFVTVIVVVVLALLYRVFATTSRKVLHAPPSDSVL